MSSVENGFLYILLGSGLLGFSLVMLAYSHSLSKAKVLITVDDKKIFLLGRIVLSTILVFSIQAALMDWLYSPITVYYYIILGLSGKELLRRELEKSI